MPNDHAAASAADREEKERQRQRYLEKSRAVAERRASEGARTRNAPASAADADRVSVPPRRKENRIDGYLARNVSRGPIGKDGSEPPSPPKQGYYSTAPAFSLPSRSGSVRREPPSDAPHEREGAPSRTEERGLVLARAGAAGDDLVRILAEYNDALERKLAADRAAKREALRRRQLERERAYSSARLLAAPETVAEEAQDPHGVVSSGWRPPSLGFAFPEAPSSAVSCASCEHYVGDFELNVVPVDLLSYGAPGGIRYGVCDPAHGACCWYRRAKGPYAVVDGENEAYWRLLYRCCGHRELIAKAGYDPASMPGTCPGCGHPL